MQNFKEISTKLKILYLKKLTILRSYPLFVIPLLAILKIFQKKTFKKNKFCSK